MKRMRRGRWPLWLLGVLMGLAGCGEPGQSPAPQARPPTASRQAPEVPREEARPRPPTDDGVASRSMRAAAAPTDTVRDVDLEGDERRGGHTIARHVGRSDAELRARLDRERIAAASSYADLESAERVVAQALADNQRRLQRWIAQRGPRSNLALRYRARDGLPTGRIMRRSDDSSTDAYGAIVVLRWRGDGFYVLTSYPEHPQ